MVEVSKKDFLVLMQENQLRLFEYVERELSLIPKEIQAINDRSRLHCHQVEMTIKIIMQNIELISLVRTREETGIKAFFEIDENGRPIFIEERRSKTSDKDNTISNNPMFL